MAQFDRNRWRHHSEIASFEVTGGRDHGYRGYIYKNNIKEGKWEVHIITQEELLLGVVDFVIKNTSESHKEGMVKKTF